MFNFGVVLQNLQFENECSPPSNPPSISEFFGDINLLKDKSYFLEKPVSVVNNQIILPFRNIDNFFSYNYYNDGRVLNYGGLIVRVFFLPNSISKIDDVELIWAKDEDYDDQCYYYIDTTPQLQSEEDDPFRSPSRLNDDTVDAKVDNIGNYRIDNGIRLFVTVRRRYQSNVWLGSFYID